MDRGKGRMSYCPALAVFTTALVTCAGSVEALEPDLRVVAVSADPSPAVGSTITVGAWIESVGASGEQFTVGLFLDRADPPSASDTPDMSVDISLFGSMSQYVTFPGITNTASESWDMYVMADCYNVVGESDEGDNVFGPVTVEWMAGGPDLVITAITPSDSTPLAGQTISVQVTVANQGTRDAEFFSVTLFEDEASAPSRGDEGDQTEYDGQLAAGAETTITFTNVSAPTQDLWDLYLIVNNDQAIGEADPANNISDLTPIVWRVTGIDLIVGCIAPSESTPVAEDTIDVDVTVFNLGTVAAGAFSVELFYSEVSAPAVGAPGDQTKQVVSLASAAGTTVTFTGVTSNVVEVWNTYAIADNGEAISEVEEGNNVEGPIWLMWREPQPDLVVAQIRPSEASPYARNDISVAVTVRNQGSTDAGAFSVELFYDETAAPSAGDPGDRGKSVTSLAAGAETTVSFAGVSSSAPGTWQMYAVADGGGAVAELDEANNVRGPEPVEWWSRPHLPECGGVGYADGTGPGWLLPFGLAGIAVLLRLKRRRETRVS